MDQQAREHMMQDLAAKIARHISQQQALQGPLPRNPENHNMVTARVLELIDRSRVELSHNEMGELCFRVTTLLFEPLQPKDPAVPDTRVIRSQEDKRMDEEVRVQLIRAAQLLFEPLQPRDPAALDTRVIRWKEGNSRDQQARDQLLDDLSISLARHISHRLGVPAPLPRNDDTYTQVKTLFTLLLSQSGINLGPLQTHELYGRMLGALFEPPAPEASQGAG